MAYLANTDQLLSDGILNPSQVKEIQIRSRDTMITLAINLFLTGGILAATFGFIFWLADPLSVAVTGGIALVLGLMLLLRGADRFSMFGNAAALIGAGMLLGGATFELVDNYEAIAAWAMTGLGGAAMIGSYALYRKVPEGLGFLTGAITLMGAAIHLGGVIGFEFEGVGAMLFYLYAAGLTFALGIALDVRLVSALAIVPFAQVLDTSTTYWHASYAFYSYESTLSILQMGSLVAGFTWLASRIKPRVGRHLNIAVMLAFIVMNLCFLVGSLWGDEVGRYMWGPQYRDFGYQNSEAYHAALDAFRETAFTISEEVYSVVWALLLMGLIAWSAMTTRRGLFNASLTFLGIHAYTQMFESFVDEPMAYALGGLAAIPAAWGLLQANSWMKVRETPTPVAHSK